MASATSNRPMLMFVTDRQRSRIPIIDAVAAAVAGGVDVVQIREKDLPLSERLKLASGITDVVAGRVAVVINSDIETAIKLGIGVHLPERGPILDFNFRSRLRPGTLIGRSIHGAIGPQVGLYDYVLSGHVFASASKPGRPPRGLETLHRVALSSVVPVWAIGGITASNVAEVLEAGATGVAVIGMILDSIDPEAATRALRLAMDTATNARTHDHTGGPMAQLTDVVSIQLNGKATDLPVATSIDDFLTGRALLGKLVVVEINGVIVPRSEFESRVFTSGDTVEVVHFVGGG